MKSSDTQISLKPRSQLSPLLEFSSPGRYSTSLQTPSPQPKNEFLVACKCGCKVLLSHHSKLNCKRCGAFAIKQADETYIFVRFFLTLD